MSPAVVAWAGIVWGLCSVVGFSAAVVRDPKGEGPVEVWLLFAGLGLMVALLSAEMLTRA